jgi:predicted DNA-binding transcriptional regulator YafY
MDWATFRVDRINNVLAHEPGIDRPADTTENWLTRVGNEGDEVTVVVTSQGRWLFETLPGAEWATLKDGRHAVKFRVVDDAFLDNLMLRAGENAFVLSGTEAHLRAGRALAKKIGESL